MLIVKRSKGAIVSTLVATTSETGKVTIAPKAPTPKAVVAATKPGKSGTRKSGSPAPQAPKDASDGVKLAFKLHHFRNVVDITEADRMSAIYKLGKFAREIGPGDPDVHAALTEARANQASYKVTDSEIDIVGRECVEGSAGAWDSWSAAFFGGYYAKVPVKGVQVFKRYLLTVLIAGQASPESDGIKRKLLDAVEAEDHTSRFEKFGDAHRAALRWYTVKSDVAHLMTVTIDTLDPAKQIPGEPPVCEPNLRTVVTLAEARDMAQRVQRRQDRGPTMFAPKSKQSLKLQVPTVHEYRATFSAG